MRRSDVHRTEERKRLSTHVVSVLGNCRRSWRDQGVIPAKPDLDDSSWTGPCVHKKQSTLLARALHMREEMKKR